MTNGSGLLSLRPPQSDAAVQHQVHVRWAEKTGGGVGANLINAAAVTPTTIAALSSEPAPSSWPPAQRVHPVETTIWELDATLVGYKLEQDQDYHLVLSDASNNTMVVEIPAPEVVDPSSLFLSQITGAAGVRRTLWTATAGIDGAGAAQRPRTHDCAH